MALHTLERRNYGGKLLLSIKYQNLHTFKEGLILLSQSVLETIRITYLHGSAHFTIPLMLLSVHQKGSNNNDILDRLSIVDKYVQIATNKLLLLK